MADTPSLAAPEDLATFLGEGIPSDQEARAGYLLRVASARARRRTGRTWLDDNGYLTTVPDEVIGVVVEAAARAYLNPEGVTAETDADYTMQRGGVGAEAGTVYFTPGQEATLAAYAVGRPRRGVFTLPTTRWDDDCRSLVETDPFDEGWRSL